MKALVQRDHMAWRSLAETLVKLVNSVPEQNEQRDQIENREKLAEISAHAFDTILADHVEDDALTKSSGATVRVLYKQKFFTIVYLSVPLLCFRYPIDFKRYPQLLDAFRATNSHFYLVAIANLLHHVPRPVLLSELPTILPLLILSLRHPSLSPSSLLSDSPASVSSVLQISATSTILMLLKEVLFLVDFTRHLLFLH